MSTKYTYLLIDFGSLLLPLIYSFHKKIQFNKEWRSLSLALVISASVFIFWDIYYTKLGVWYFNEKYLTGIKIYNLPIEEVLFFICIPYSSLFTYYCFEKFRLNSSWLQGKWISLLISIGLFLFGILYYDKLYTGVTFVSLALIIVYVAFIKNSSWLANFYLMFIVILIPFFIVNGLLTGTGLEEPVVLYNDNENCGIRLLTIPFEDIFYGMLLLLLNTMIFEQFRKKSVG